VADDVERWSNELARNPSSLVFLQLAEALRRAGQLEVARKVVTRGLERHPHNPDAHDQLARIHADAGDLQAAFDEWDMVLHMSPGHVGAIKGMAFVRFQQGRHAEAEQLLLQAQSASDQRDGDVAAAIATVRRSSSMATIRMATAELSADPRFLFVDVLESDQTAIMLDKDGLVLAGSYLSPDGHDVAEDVGATLSGVPAEAKRACKHLNLGEWRSISFETEAAIVTLAPAPAGGGLAAGGLMVVAASATTPLGNLRLLMDRCVDRAAFWLNGAGGEQ
jgi:predicted regulator of Ras-like GTPase activity (Roadblock/LC7/MglB family)